MWPTQRLQSLLKIEHPIIQGPFGGGMSSVELMKTVSNAGGLGSFGAQPLTPEEILKLVAELKTETSKPFSVNLWVSDQDSEVDSISEEDWQQYVGNFSEELLKAGISALKRPTHLGPRFSEQLEAVLAAKPPIASFIFGVPDQSALERLRAAGILTLGTATTVDEAICIEKSGMDCVVVSGVEAGGHRGSFLRGPEESQLGLMSLLPQVADAVKIPIVAAGGICDARGVAAAFELGASGVQIGSAFVACDESNAPLAYKLSLRSRGQAGATTLTKAFTGRFARAIENDSSRKFDAKNLKAAPYPVQRWIFAQLKAHAVQENNTHLMAMWAGQSYPMIRHTRALDFFNHLVQSTLELI